MSDIKIRLTDEQVQDIVDTALEGGIGYWADLVAEGRTIDGPTARIREIGDGDLDGDEPFPVHDITPEVIRRGFALYPPHLLNVTHIVGSLHLGDLVRVGLDVYEYDDIDADAGAADLIVQFGLFGEERYA
jgi:hypothetical protein